MGGGDAHKIQTDNPIPAIDFPAAIPSAERCGILLKLFVVPVWQQADILNVLAARIERAAAGQSAPIDDIQAYTARLVRKALDNALDVPQSVAEGRKNDAISVQMDKLRAGIEEGKGLFCNGRKTEVVRWPLAEGLNGLFNVAAMIEQGVTVEVRRCSPCLNP